MVSSSSQDFQKSRDELARSQAAMGLLCLREVREKGSRNWHSAAQAATSSASGFCWSKAEEESAMLRKQLKDAYLFIVDFLQQHAPLLEHLKDMLPSTGRWSEAMRQDMIYRMNVLKLELERTESTDYDWKDWNKYQEKIKAEMGVLRDAMKMITESPCNNSSMETGDEENGGDGEMMYEVGTPNIISIVGASPPAPPPTSSGDINTEKLSRSMSARDLEEEQGTSGQTHYEHVIDKSKAKLGFFCTCGMEFRSKDDLLYHVKVESASSGLATDCTPCKVCFSSPEELITHRKSVHKISPCPADLEKISMNQLRHSRGSHADNMPSNCPDWDDSIDELIQPPSGQMHAVDVNKSHLGAYCICGHLCSNRNALQHHTWYRTNASRIKCDFCPQTYPGYSYLIRHQYSAHKHTPPSFPNTDEVVIVSKENLERVQLKGNSTSGTSTPGSSKPKRKSTGRAASTDQKLHGLNTEEQSNGIFSCLCTATFQKFPSLQKHIKNYTSGPALPCKMCGNRFYNVKYLKAHITKEHGITPSSVMKPCYDCRLVFETHLEHEDHFQSVHKSDTLSSGVKKVRAANRRKQTKSKEVQHGVLHVFDVEDDDYDNSDGRSDSGSSTSSPRPSYCKCGAIFSTRLALDIHLRDTTARLIFKCDWCTKSFNSHAGLKSHIQRFHKEKNYDRKYGCTLCGRTFHTRQQLTAHHSEKHRCHLEMLRQTLQHNSNSSPVSNSSSGSSTTPML